MNTKTLITDVEDMRAYISDAYDSARWKNRVVRMPDKQVMAIFFNFMSRINKRKKQKSESLKAIEMGEALVQGFARGISEDDYEQVSFDDYLERKSLEEYLR